MWSPRLALTFNYGVDMVTHKSDFGDYSCKDKKPLYSSDLYRAAIDEFDELWETCRSGQNRERMRQLLSIIEELEGGVF